MRSLWDCAVSDDEVARALLEELHQLPDTIGGDPAGVLDRLTGRAA
ncbi:hypothetical protein [Nonomuraea sp. NPDC049709]